MFKGKIDKITAEKLRNGETCEVIGYGNSMLPLIKSGETVTVVPITKNTILKKNDIVFCKVKGNLYLHKISAVRGKAYQISNNHGHINGTIGINSIYGIVQR